MSRRKQLMTGKLRLRHYNGQVGEDRLAMLIHAM